MTEAEQRLSDEALAMEVLHTTADGLKEQLTEWVSESAAAAPDGKLSVWESGFASGAGKMIDMLYHLADLLKEEAEQVAEDSSGGADIA